MGHEKKNISHRLEALWEGEKGGEEEGEKKLQKDHQQHFFPPPLSLPLYYAKLRAYPTKYIGTLSV